MALIQVFNYLTKTHPDGLPLDEIKRTLRNREFFGMGNLISKKNGKYVKHYARFKKNQSDMISYKEIVESFKEMDHNCDNYISYTELYKYVLRNPTYR
jgi:hypothetical protein